MEKLDLNTPLTSLPKVGPKTAAALARVNLNKIADLIEYFPRDYRDFSHLSTVSQVNPGQEVVIRGKIINLAARRAFHKHLGLTTALVQEDTGVIEIIWFNQPYLAKTLKKGLDYLFGGTIERKGNKLQMISPDWEAVKSTQTHLGRIVPVYRTIGSISTKMIRFWISYILDNLPPVEETLSIPTLKRQNLISRDHALHYIHFPPSKESLENARKRLAFEEAFLLAERQHKERTSFQKQPGVPIIGDPTPFIAQLPFQLTSAQKRCIKEALTDLKRRLPMRRLLNGDVGSGKTVVATALFYLTARAGWQSACMTPTDVLASQHFQTIIKLCRPFCLKIALHTASSPASPKDIENADIIVGTHSLIQPKVKIPRLALAVIDEQHRFGVNQRDELLKKGGKITPHYLSMTATPIPQTLAKIIYGDLDLSLLDELPKNRIPIKTFYIPRHKRNDAYTFIKQELDHGHQAFVVCPIIEESDELGVRSVTQEYEKLKLIFKGYSIGMLHGKLSKEEKTQVLENLRLKKLSLLISTSVIEVGIDIPNATIMMIEGADRFGLAQLHQLRGRVGRSDKQSFCFLFADQISPDALDRLKTIVRCGDGFKLADADLKQRGPGNYWGTEQSGWATLRFTSLWDTELIRKVSSELAKLSK